MSLSQYSFFLDVLKHVKAIVFIDNLSEYLMPCALAYVPDEQCEPDRSTPWVIRFRIKRGGIEEAFIPLPVGYLPTLVIFLLACFGSEFTLNRKDRQFRNRIVLKYSQGGKVYIVERHLQLEVYFTMADKFPEKCSHSRHNTGSNIAKASYRKKMLSPRSIHSYAAAVVILLTMFVSTAMKQKSQSAKLLTKFVNLRIGICNGSNHLV